MNHKNIVKVMNLIKSTENVYNSPGFSENPTLSKISKISRIAIFYSNSRLNYVIDIPLLEKNLYRLFKHYPLPKQIQDSVFFTYIFPTYEYTVINNDRDKYFNMNERNLDVCIKFKETFICEVQPLLRINDNSACEIKLLIHEKSNIHKNYNIRIKRVYQSVFQKKAVRDMWLFSVINRTDLNIICKQESFHEEIVDSGMIKLESECEVKSREIVLKPAKAISYTQSYKFTEPFINLTNMVENSMNFQSQNLS